MLRFTTTLKKLKIVKGGEEGDAGVSIGKVNRSFSVLCSIRNEVFALASGLYEI